MGRLWSDSNTVSKVKTSLFVAIGLTRDDLEGARYSRVKSILRLLEQGRVDSDLRWRKAS